MHVQTTIAFKYDNKEYFMDVVDTEDENGDSVPSICIQVGGVSVRLGRT